MRYQKLGRSGFNASILGIGGVPIHTMNFEETKTIIDCGHESGINLLDIYMATAEVRDNLGRCLKGRRGDFIIQGHIGTVEENGQTVRSRDLKTTQKSFEDLLKRLHTKEVEIGVLYYIDSPEDYEAVFHSPVIDYVQKLKEQGVIGAIGMGSHNPVTALRAVETDLIDVLMFSINPAYDLAKTEVDLFTLRNHKGFDTQGLRIDTPRQTLYQRCQEKNVAITVMKALGAGTLLDAETSPFGKALTPAQCIHYALSRPAAASVILGCRTSEEIKAGLQYLETSEKDLDFSHIFEGNPSIIPEGNCMYCNHCQPCPSEIDIAAVTKFLDMARGKSSLSSTVLDHYNALPKTAEDCIGCGDCEENCPFGVEIRKNMEEAKVLFKID